MQDLTPRPPRRRPRYVAWGVTAGLVVAVGGAAETFFGLIGSAFAAPEYDTAVYAAEVFGVTFVLLGLALFAFASTRAVTATAYGAAAAAGLLVVDFVIAALMGPDGVDWSLVGFFVVRVAVPLVAARRAFQARSVGG
jgi:hypothetical protein